MKFHPGRKIITSALLALCVILAGCLDDEKEIAAKISTQPADQTVLPDSSAAFGIAAGGSGTIHYQWMMGGVNMAGETKDTLKVSSTMHDSVFTCIVSNGVGSDTSAPVKLYLAWKGESTLPVAAQGNTAPGSAVDFDIPVPETLNSSVATANQEVIDLMFVYSGSALKLMSPVAARDARDVSNPVNGYTSAQDTKFVKVAEKPVNQEAGITVYNAGPLTNAAVVTEGDQFIVKTTGNRYVYIKMGPIQGEGAMASTNLAVSVGTL